MTLAAVAVAHHRHLLAAGGAVTVVVAAVVGTVAILGLLWTHRLDPGPVPPEVRPGARARTGGPGRS